MEQHALMAVVYIESHNHIDNVNECESVKGGREKAKKKNERIIIFFYEHLMIRWNLFFPLCSQSSSYIHFESFALILHFFFFFSSSVPFAKHIRIQSALGKNNWNRRPFACAVVRVSILFFSFFYLVNFHVCCCCFLVWFPSYHSHVLNFRFFFLFFHHFILFPFHVSYALMWTGKCVCMCCARAHIFSFLLSNRTGCMYLVVGCCFVYNNFLFVFIPFFYDRS